jgi:hypothetical protein
MTKLELLDIISDLIVDNSNIGAKPDDEVLLDGLEDVMLNVSATDGDVTLQFTNGEAMKITVEQDV